jgi:hypothetical protein
MTPWAFLLICASLPGQPAERAPFGYLWQPAFCLDTLRRGPATPYEPLDGDLIVFNSNERLWKMSYYLALSAPPTHSGVVLRMSDGAPVLLESGIGFNLNVEISPLATRLAEYNGAVYVRRRKTPLTKDESARLTDFALAVHKKRVPPIRFIAQVTPIRMRGPLRTECIGYPHGVRHGYTCSELAVETFVAAGLLDAETARPAATYPRDLFFDHSCNPHLNRHLCPAISAGWHAPALWSKE